MAEVVALPGMAYSRSGNAPAKTKRKAPARRRPDRGPRAAAAPAPLSLRAAKRDVFDLGATGLDKRQRKIRDDARLAALGCKAPRNPKMPFKMVLGIRRAEDARERKRLAERRESGVVAPKEKRDAARGGSRKGKRGRRGDALAPDPRDGVLRVDHLAKRRKKCYVSPRSGYARGPGSSAPPRRTARRRGGRGAAAAASPRRASTSG